LNAGFDCLVHPEHFIHAADRITGYKHFAIANGAAQTSLDQNFSYDELARLTGVTYGTSSWTLGYDANGNRTGASLNGTNTAYTTPATSNKTSTIGAAALTYDAAGNITGQTGTNAYTTTINLEGRIATLVKGTVTTTYAYNGMGQRVRKFSSSGATSTTIFVYDQQGNLLGEYGNTGTPIREYVWMNGELVAIFTPNGTNPPNIFYVHNDHLGSPKLVYTKANVLRWRWMTEPFGTTAPENTPTAGQAAFTQPIRFPGQYHDTESNLFYNHHRTYDQTSGRYTQSDPIGLAGGINTYAYVGGNPISWIDPNGLMGRGSGGSGMRNVYTPGQGPGQSIGDFASGLGNAYYNMMSRIDRSLSSIGSGSSPAGTGQCVTAECAAGLLPAPSDNRTQAQIDVGLCTLVCNISAAGPVAACNVAAGGGLVGGVAGAATRMSICSMVCQP
jgi:RHS repeat-associated protein